jgi:chromosome segregation protein
VFDVQRQLETKQREIHALESRVHADSIELAKFTTRRETLEAEMNLELSDALRAKINNEEAPTKTAEELRNDALEIRRLKGQLEWIGGIDPDVIKEHTETETRFNFLETQVTDLAATIVSLKTMIKELETSIEAQFKEAFEAIQEKFNHYFGILFKDGQAKLTLLENEPVADNPDDPSFAESTEDKLEDTVRGIDIQAVPAGKRFKSIHMLSGGEKALTAIALLAAILDYNPPPFIVLDEVDAALDEANSERFAKIVHELATFSQFIVITHNRATMHEADLLYGVTMGSDGVSKILSLELTAAEANPA